jgi:hypothetical protein
MHEDTGRIPIWFFIGALVLVFGILIECAGLYGLAYPPEPPVVLAGLHAELWWGGLMILLGTIYTARFFPKKDAQ